jgi:NADPH-dependent 7-cyano-7-deazaguanine reductase QueF
MNELTIPYAGTAGLTLTVTADLTHVCPVVKERDFGKVAITYKPATSLLELHALRRYLDGYDGLSITHEELTASIKTRLTADLKPEFLTVTTAWTTAGLSYEVTA